MQTGLRLSRNTFKPIVLVLIALGAALAWFVVIPLGGSDYLEQVRANRWQTQKNITQYLSRATVGSNREEIDLLFAPVSFFERIGREVPKTKSGEKALAFYLSESGHDDNLPLQPTIPVMRIDDGYIAAPLESNIIIDSVHHRTTAVFYPLADPSGRQLITDETRKIELLFAFENGVTALKWDLPIVYSGLLSEDNSLSLAALVALAAGLLAALSPCLLQQTVYYLGTMTGAAVYETNQTRSISSARLVPTALAFILGFTIVYTAAGAIAGAAGQAIMSLGTLTEWNRPIAVVSGVMLILMAIWLAVRARAPLVCNLPLPKVLRSGKRFGFIGNLLMGAGIALGCVTCFGGAVFAALMFYLGSSGSPAQGAAAMLVFSIGVAVPYLISALAFSRIAPLLERVQRFTPYLALASAAIVFFFGIVMITDNFHSLSNSVFQMLARR